MSNDILLTRCPYHFKRTWYKLESLLGTLFHLRISSAQIITIIIQPMDNVDKSMVKEKMSLRAVSTFDWYSFYLTLQ